MNLPGWSPPNWDGEGGWGLVINFTTSDLGRVVLKVMSVVYVCYIISNRSDLEGVEIKPNMKGKYT